MDLEATKFFRGPRGSLLRAVALVFFLIASLMMISSLLTYRHASLVSPHAAVSVAAIEFSRHGPDREF